MKDEINEVYLIPREQWDKTALETLADQFYTVKALTDPQYRQDLEDFIDAKRKERERRGVMVPRVKKKPS